MSAAAPEKAVAEFEITPFGRRPKRSWWSRAAGRLLRVLSAPARLLTGWFRRRRPA